MTDLAACISDSSFASNQVRRFLLRTTSTSHRGSPGYRKAIVYASTASTCGTKRAVWSTGRTTTRKGGTLQVGSNTTGGPISNTPLPIPLRRNPNTSLDRNASGNLFLNLLVAAKVE